MNNAISAFDTQTKFYKGKKIIALGQISDLGRREEEIHLKLLERLNSSKADIILLMDTPYRKIYKNVDNIKVEWFANKKALLNRLLTLADEDSLILLKSSVTNTNFPEVAKELPGELRKL